MSARLRLNPGQIAELANFLEKLNEASAETGWCLAAGAEVELGNGEQPSVEIGWDQEDGIYYLHEVIGG